MTNQTEARTIKTYIIDGVRIPLVKLQPSQDVRFLSQKQLFALASPAAYAELNARAAIIRARAA